MRSASGNNDSVCFNSPSGGRGGAYCYACRDGKGSTSDNDGHAEGRRQVKMVVREAVKEEEDEDGGYWWWW